MKHVAAVAVVALAADVVGSCLVVLFPGMTMSLLGGATGAPAP